MAYPLKHKSFGPVHTGKLLEELRVRKWEHRMKIRKPFTNANYYQHPLGDSETLDHSRSTGRKTDFSNEWGLLTCRRINILRLLAHLRKIISWIRRTNYSHPKPKSHSPSRNNLSVVVKTLTGPSFIGRNDGAINRNWQEPHLNDQGIWNLFPSLTAVMYIPFEINGSDVYYHSTTLAIRFLTIQKPLD